MAEALLLPFNGVMPRVHPSAFLAPGSIIIGDVEIGAESSIWYNCALRGDINCIKIGERTNIQDGSVIHVAAEGNGTIIGNDVTVGHMALLHGCTIHDHAFIGMKATVIDGAVVESYGVLAAGALLTPNKTLPSGQLWAGNPAKFFRPVAKEEAELFAFRSTEYVMLAHAYQK